MIRLSVLGGDGRWHTEYVALANVARVTEARHTSPRQGIKSIVRIFDGAALECAETCDQVLKAIDIARGEED